MRAAEVVIHSDGESGRPWALGPKARHVCLVLLVLAYVTGVGHRAVVFAPGGDGAGAATQALHILSGEGLNRSSWIHPRTPASFDPGTEQACVGLPTQACSGPPDPALPARSPGFPIFLALAYLLGLPSILALSLVYAAACVRMATVVGSVLGSRWIAVPLLGLLLFVPPLASSKTARLDGHFLAASLTLLTVAGALRLWTSPTPPRSPRGLAILTGFCAALLGITCQDGVAVVPVLLMLPLCAMGDRCRRADVPKSCGIALLSAVLLLGVVGLAGRTPDGGSVATMPRADDPPVDARGGAGQADAAWRKWPRRVRETVLAARMASPLARDWPAIAPLRGVDYQWPELVSADQHQPGQLIDLALRVSPAGAALTFSGAGSTALIGLARHPEQDDSTPGGQAPGGEGASVAALSLACLFEPCAFKITGPSGAETVVALDAVARDPSAPIALTTGDDLEVLAFERSDVTLRTRFSRGIAALLPILQSAYAGFLDVGGLCAGLVLVNAVVRRRLSPVATMVLCLALAVLAEVGTVAVDSASHAVVDTARLAPSYPLSVALAVIAITWTVTRTAGRLYPRNGR